MHVADHILLTVSPSYRKQLEILLTVGRHPCTPHLHCVIYYDSNSVGKIFKNPN